MSIASQLEAEVKKRALVLMLDAQFELARVLDAAEPPRRTGELHRSRSIVVRNSLANPALTVTYASMHANYTDEGTRPHMIFPRRARALRFPATGRRNPRTGRFQRPGGWVFAAWVRHPGTRGTRWFRRSTSLTSWRAILRRLTS